MKKLFPFAALLLVALMGSCTNDLNSNFPSENLSSENAVSLKSVNADSLSSVNSSPEYLMASAAMASKKQNPNPKGGSIQVVNLGIAGEFVILSKSGITNVYKSSVTGDVGTSPITGAAIGLTCAEVAGTIYTVDAAGPLPYSVTNASRLTTAVGNMQTAYTDAAGRSNPNFLNLGAGNIGGKTLKAGLYKFTSNVVIPTDITISGNSNDVWIFQVAGTLNVSSAVRITLAGGAQAKNIFWQTSGAVTLGTTSHFEGTILSQTAINMQTGASVKGRLLAQTEVTLQMNVVTKP